jgi:hypothetical protein
VSSEFTASELEWTGGGPPQRSPHTLIGCQPTPSRGLMGPHPTHTPPMPVSVPIPVQNYTSCKIYKQITNGI